MADLVPSSYFWGLRGITGIPFFECCKKIKFHIKLAWPWIPSLKSGGPSSSALGSALWRQRKCPLGGPFLPAAVVPGPSLGAWDVASSLVRSWVPAGYIHMPGSGHLAWPLWFGGPVSKEQCCNSFGVEFRGEEKDLLPSQRPLLGQVGLAPRHHESLCLTPHPISGNYNTRVTWLFSACRGMQTHTHRGTCIHSNTLGMPPHSHARSHSYMRAHSWTCLYNVHTGDWGWSSACPSARGVIGPLPCGITCNPEGMSAKSAEFLHKKTREEGMMGRQKTTDIYGCILTIVQKPESQSRPGTLRRLVATCLVSSK